MLFSNLFAFLKRYDIIRLRNKENIALEIVYIELKPAFIFEGSSFTLELFYRGKNYANATRIRSIYLGWRDSPSI